MEITKNFSDQTFQKDNLQMMLASRILNLEKQADGMEYAIDSFDGTPQQEDNFLNMFDKLFQDLYDIKIYTKWVLASDSKNICPPKDVLKVSEYCGYDARFLIVKKLEELLNR
jgi:hypothetical protein